MCEMILLVLHWVNLRIALEKYGIVDWWVKRLMDGKGNPFLITLSSYCNFTAAPVGTTRPVLTCLGYLFILTYLLGGEGDVFARLSWYLPLRLGISWAHGRRWEMLIIRTVSRRNRGIRTCVEVRGTLLCLR